MVWSDGQTLCPLEDYAQAVIEWLLRAQRATPDDGVSEGYHVVTRQWSPSYPETTGYIICSLLRAARYGLNQPDVLRDAARRMGSWLLTTQLGDGAFPGGNVGVVDPKPSIFNTGQILKGLTDLIHGGLDEDEKYRHAAKRAAQRLMDLQDADGAWRRDISALTTEPVHAYNVRTAWALARYGMAVGDGAAIQAGIRNAEWLLPLQDAQGWFPHMNFDVGKPPLTHTVAYTIRGMLELGVLCERPAFVVAATRAATRMRSLQDPDTGAVPSQVDAPYRAIVDWTNSTGNSQLAIIWFRLAAITGDHAWKEAAERANRFNCLLQKRDMQHTDLGRRGAVRGSFPGHRGYGRYWYMNWTQKFHLDALLAQLGATIN